MYKGIDAVNFSTSTKDADSSSNTTHVSRPTKNKDDIDNTVIVAALTISWKKVRIEEWWVTLRCMRNPGLVPFSLIPQII